LKLQTSTKKKSTTRVVSPQFQIHTTGNPKPRKQQPLAEKQDLKINSIETSNIIICIKKEDRKASKEKNSSEHFRFSGNLTKG
jgi:hypothetical protein